MKKNGQKKNGKEHKGISLNLPEKTKKQIGGVVFLLLALTFSLGFFGQAGRAGDSILNGLNLLVGKAVFFLPFIFVLIGLVFFLTPYEKFIRGLILAGFLLMTGISAILEVIWEGSRYGGYLGYVARPVFSLFGFWVSQIIFAGFIAASAIIFWHLLGRPKPKNAPSLKENGQVLPSEPEKKPSFIKKFFLPKFKVQELEPVPASRKESDAGKDVSEPKPKSLTSLGGKYGNGYQLPSLDLLETEKGTPAAGDIRNNSAIIKKTLENFAISVEMSEINIGPTVTQYTLKPAEGVKLSRITGLSNDLSLALASHPIRIEAPIPGKSLVGIEVPNKVRARVRLKDMISSPRFQAASSNLTLCLGSDVSGNPLYTDLAKMPHLLVAGSTGTGKTIFLNSLILSLLYRNSPEILRFILVDPKRVEFPVYNDLPHLLCPVILEAQKTINALKWLVSEMERRFGVLAGVKTRDIGSFNELALKNEEELLPYIVVIIDELADLMASRGKEVEAAIVRLAQMARAVGIHLIVATQRPSVEVITGLIKANITSRVTFQVASQVDSRTVLDAAGAEKLLGLGDLLFVSAEVAKPKRIQGPFVSEKEVRKVVDSIKTQNSKLNVEKIDSDILENHFAVDLGRALESKAEEFDGSYDVEDSLYEDARRIIIEAKKASASLLQRRLRIGYARAARLIDILEERGVVGPADGAKPRAILLGLEEKAEGEENNEEWKKI